MSTERIAWHGKKELTTRKRQKKKKTLWNIRQLGLWIKMGQAPYFCNYLSGTIDIYLKQVRRKQLNFDDKTICRKKKTQSWELYKGRNRGMPPLYHHSCYPTKDAQRNHFFYKKNSTWNHLCLWITEQKAVVITKAEPRATRNCNQEQYTILLLTLKLA